MEKVKLITYSSMQMFKDCRAKWYWRYIAELVSNKISPALSFGSAYHKGIEVWYKTGNEDEAQVAANESFMTNLLAAGYQANNQYEADVANITMARLKYLLVSYFHTYLDEQNEPGESELQLTIPLKSKDPVTYQGKIDRVGAGFIHEYKSASRIMPFSLDKLELDFQISLYLWGLRSLRPGDHIEKVKYRIGLKDSYRQGKYESVAEFIIRLESFYQQPETQVQTIIHRDSHKIDEVGVEMKQILKDMRRCLKEKTFYRNTSFCTTWGGCQYIMLCASSPVNLDDTIRLGFHQEDPHIELKRDD